MRVTRTQISFGVVRRFAWVWLPQMWIKKQPEHSITLTFSLGRHEADNRIKKAVEPYPGRWTHHVIIEHESGFDATIKGWLREAYTLGTKPRRKMS